MQTDITVVHPAGIEPATSGLGNRCSILLSYGCVGYAIATRARQFKEKASGFGLRRDFRRPIG